MIRNELQIVYATLRDLVLSYPELANLPAPPRFVFDYTPESIVEPRAGASGDEHGQPAFPAVGISRVGNTSHKLLDKHEDYARTEKEGERFVWREAGRFDQACQVALFVSSDAEIYNPVVFLRGWAQWLEKRIVDEVLFPTINDCVPDERLQISATAKMLMQEGKMLHSIKLTVNTRGKFLVATRLTEPPAGGKPLRITVNTKP